MNESTQFLMYHGNAVLFAIVFVEQAGLPLPAAPWLLAAGVLSAGGRLNLALAVATVALACVAADWIWFAMGRGGGQRVLRWLCRWSLAPGTCVGRTKDLFARHGLQGLVAAKFLPGLGALMPPVAGALGVSTGRFLMFDGLGSLIYGTVYIVAGFLFHAQIQGVVSVLNALGVGLLLAALVSVFGYLAFKYVRRTWPTRGEKAGSRGSALAGEFSAGRHKVPDHGGQPSINEDQATMGAENVTLALTGGPSHPSPGVVEPTICCL